MSNAAFDGIKAVVFDAYGTLFDFGSAAARSPDIPDEKRAALTAIWRDKQIQYALLRSLQGNFADFEQVTGEALDFALETLGLVDADRRARLLALYRRIAAYPEVPDTLRRLRDQGLQTAILSNGSVSMLQEATTEAGIDALLDAVLSVDTVRVFKPDPRVYRLATAHFGVEPDAVCFVSSNGWDAYSAADFGFRVAWCNRSGQKPERLPGTPKAVIGDLSALPALLSA